MRSDLTLTAAATACRVSRDVMRRRLDAGRFPNAHRDPDRPGRPWLVPVADLVAAGLTPEAPTAPPTAAAHPLEDTRRQELAALRADLERTRHRADLERTRADTLERALTLAETALRALGPATTPTPATAGAHHQADPAGDSRRHKWWHRKQKD